MIRNLCFLTCIAAVACSPVSQQRLTREFQGMEKKFQHHTGFELYDPEKKRTIISFNGSKYFTPASNTKILTFYTSLMLLGDSIPGIYYATQGDSLIFWGTGDPSFLYDKVPQSGRVYSFLKETKRELYFSADNFNTTPLGPGWAWSDYNYAYSAERSALPVYGNTYTVTQPTAEGIRVSPPYFKKYFWLADTTSSTRFVRQLESNRTEFYPGKSIAGVVQRRVPFKTEPLTISNLLEDTLKRSVTLTRASVNPYKRSVIFNAPADSVYKVMMQDSDNFIAEQLLLVCAGMLSDTLKPELAIRYMQNNSLADLPDKPVWVDGSGLSRYNLITPRSLVKLWNKIYLWMHHERLFELVAIGGQTGTLKYAYVNDPPYIYGKTGTLSNNHSLSGYLITRKGDTLIFSFMNSNFTAPVSEVRAEMERILKIIHNKY